MNESEWLSCEEPRPMLELLAGKASPRKLRLFLCACCWSVGQIPGCPFGPPKVVLPGSFGFMKRMVSQLQYWLFNHPFGRAVEMGERFADGDATRSELDNVMGELEFAWDYCVALACDPRRTTIEHAYEVIDWIRDESPLEEPRQADLVRDIFHPFRSGGNSAWVAQDNLTLRLAQAIYADRAFDRLPILADSLEDAGCTDGAILEHCRGPGPHVPGCWVLDLLRGKE